MFHSWVYCHRILARIQPSQLGQAVEADSPIIHLSLSAEYARNALRSRHPSFTALRAVSAATTFFWTLRSPFRILRVAGEVVEAIVCRSFRSADGHFVRFRRAARAGLIKKRSSSQSSDFHKGQKGKVVNKPVGVGRNA
jgi:hypothetical protein